MFATKRRHGRRRPRANTREGEIPALSGLQFPLPLGTTGCRREQTQSAARMRHRQSLLPVTLSPRGERAPSQDGKGSFQSTLNKTKNSPPQSKNAVNKSITIFGVEPNYSSLLTSSIISASWLRVSFPHIVAIHLKGHS